MEQEIKKIIVKTNIKELEVLFDELKTVLNKIKNFESKPIGVETANE